MIEGCCVDECRERLFHSYWRASATDISGRGQQFLHRYQVTLLVSRDSRRRLQINLLITRNHTYKVARAITTQYECLKDGGYILIELLGNVRGCEVFLIHGIGNQFVSDLCTVEQSRRIGLFDFRIFSHLLLKSKGADTVEQPLLLHFTRGIIGRD